MIKAEQIPDEAVNAYMHMIVYGGVDGAEAIAAALNAWPGWFSGNAWPDLAPTIVLLLPQDKP